jgi:hypothetical protein
MIETLYKTATPEKEISECYVLVLTARPGRDHKACLFMEEHGHLDNVSNRFIHEVSSISAEDDLTQEQAVAMYDRTKRKLAERGFVHSFSPDRSRKAPRTFHPVELAVSA